MDTAETIKQLDRIRLLALVDAAALVVLVACAVTNTESVVHVLGPIHGIGFIGLLYLCVKGAGEDRWGWWFPALVLVTAGPPRSLIGDVRIRRELAEEPAAA